MTSLEDAARQLLVTFHDEPRETDEGVIIGDDYGTVLVERNDGMLVSVYERGDLPARYVNASQAAFRDCLTLYGRFLRTIRAKETTFDRQSLENLRQQIASTDPTALSHEEAWWPLILEQLEYELP